mgnify:CR=1 FL=1
MNPLDQLKDIHLPQDVSMWPLAWPWWAMLVSLISVLVFISYYMKKTKWRKHALQQLQKIDTANNLECTRQCNRLLKQVALLRFGKECASLSGEKWLDFLDSKVKNNIFKPHLSEFASAIDTPNSSIDVHTLKIATATWIRKHTC